MKFATFSLFSFAVMSAKAVTSQNAEATPVVVVSGPDANTCYNEAWNTAINDAINNIRAQAYADQEEGGRGYHWLDAGSWNDFFGTILTGCEEGEHNELWKVGYQASYVLYHTSNLKRIYDECWGDSIPLGPSSGPAHVKREALQRMMIKKRHGTQW